MKNFCFNLGVSIVVSVLALSGCGGGGGGGSSSSGGNGGGGGGDMGQSQYSAEQRSAAMDLAADRYDALLQANPSTALDELAAFMKTQPEFSDATAVDGTVVAHFKDGRPFVFFDNFKGDVLNEGEVDSGPMAMAAPTPVPGKTQALLLQASIDDTKFHTPYMTKIAQMLSNRGYSTTTSTMIDVDSLKSAPPLGVFYIHTHGAAFWWHDNFDSREYALMTDALVNDENEIKYADDIQKGRLIYSRSRNFHGSNPDPNYKGRYCLTSRFIAAYLTFQPRGLVYINACNGGAEKSSLFRETCHGKGAGLYIGYDGSTTAFGYESAAYFFDRMLGGNLAEPPTPAGRVFKLDEVWAKMKEKRHPQDPSYDYLTDPINGSTLKKFEWGTTMLTPNIKSLQFLYNDYMAILTDVPADSQDVKVTIDGKPFDYQWSDGKIMVHLNPNTKGDVMLEVNGLFSNKRPIVTWKGDVVYEQPIAPGTGTDPKLTVTYHLHLRADAYALRKEVDGELLNGDRSFWAAMDTSASYAFSGSTGGATWSGGGQFPYGDHAGAGNTFGCGGLVEATQNRMRLMLSFYEPKATVSGNGTSFEQVYAPAVGGYEFTDNFPVPGRENVMRGWFLDFDNDLSIKAKVYDGRLNGITLHEVSWQRMQADPPFNPDTER